MSTSCKCSEFGNFVKASDSHPYFGALPEVATKDHGWTSVRKCSQCGQHWQVDSWDKLQVNLAIKIDTPHNWENTDDQPLRLAALIEFRGGFTNEDCVWVGVQDFGIGIAQEDQDRIFDAFFQVDGSSTRRYGGTGTGLALAMLLAAGMNTSIEVESQPDKGSMFSFSLPVASLDDIDD